jgi:GNAT superfamily N-acetyltransferase
MASDYGAVRKLAPSDPVAGFDCGDAGLNNYLQRFALAAQRANSSQSYIVLAGTEIAGFYSLAVGAAAPADATSRVLKGLSRQPVPVMLLPRLAVALPHQGHGLGTALMRDALLRTAAAADIAGIRALLVHAKDDEARRFYLRYEFEPSPTDPLHLFLLLKDLKALLR